MDTKNLEERKDEICQKFNVTRDRFDKCFDFLMQDFPSEISAVDYLESQIKMLYYGAANKLPGEE